MNEMKRRVAAILEFVNRMQTEKHSRSTSASGSDKGSRSANTPNGTADASAAASSVNSVALIQAVDAGLLTGLGISNEKNYVEMASGEMMDMLTKELVQWQSLYGKHGEK